MPLAGARGIRVALPPGHDACPDRSDPVSATVLVHGSPVALYLQLSDLIREQITQLQVIENDLNEALAYLDSCQPCSTEFAPTECGECNHQGHHKGEAPLLFAGLSKRSPEEKEFDVPVTVLYREGNN